MSPIRQSDHHRHHQPVKLLYHHILQKIKDHNEMIELRKLSHERGHETYTHITILSNLIVHNGNDFPSIYRIEK